MNFSFTVHLFCGGTVGAVIVFECLTQQHFSLDYIAVWNLYS